jgi:hypothetical protein
MAVRVSLLCALLFVAGSASAADPSNLRQQLEAILELDQRHRGPNRTAPWSEVEDEQTAIDLKNVAEVEELVRTYGWPRRSEVGEDAAMAAFLAIQHADVAVQERYLPVIQVSVDEGEAKPAWLALLTDRILVARGKPQLYGTQSRFNSGTGESELLEIEDPAQVNERRALLGLKPLKRVPGSDWAHCPAGGSIHFVPSDEACDKPPVRDRVRISVLDLGDPLAPALIVAVQGAMAALSLDRELRAYLGGARMARLRDGGIRGIRTIAPDWSNSHGPDTYTLAFDSVDDVVLSIDPRTGRHEWAVQIE